MGGAAAVSEENCFLSGYVLFCPEGLSHSKKTKRSKYLQTSYLCAQDGALTHSWIQYTTLKRETQQTCKFRKYLHMLYHLHLCSIPPLGFGTAANATVCTEKYGKVLVLFYTSFPLFHLYA